MKKLLVLLLVVASMLLAWQCANSPATTLEVGGVVAGIGEPPIDQTWISPAKVEIANFYPGARAEWELQVHNGNSAPATFAVAYRYPDNVGEGYTKPTLDVQDWVVVTDTTPVIAAKSTESILVSVTMPKNAGSPGKQWEFWISVRDMSQTGMVRTELCSRWLVSMR